LRPHRRSSSPGDAGAAAVLVVVCLLLCCDTGAPRVVSVPSPDFAVLGAAIDATASSGASSGATIVLGDGRHDLGPSPIVLRHSLRLKAAGGAMVGGGVGGREWNARLRGAFDLDGAPHGVVGAFEDVSIENQRSTARPETSVGVLEIIGGTWDMTRCQIAGAGTGVEYQALVELGGEPAAPPEGAPPESKLRACNSPTLTLLQCCVRALHESEIDTNPEDQEVCTECDLF
jgi:hypothetical protein